MMYGGLPAASRRWVILSLSAAWSLSGAAGISAIFASPNTIVSEIGRGVVYALGAILVISVIVAVVGVISSRYWMEWVASWGAAASLVPYLVTVWALTFTGETTRLTQAFLMTSLLAFYMTRSALCSAHAAKLRAAHEASALIENALTGPVDTEGGESDGGTSRG